MMEKDLKKSVTFNLVLKIQALYPCILRLNMLCKFLSQDASNTNQDLYNLIS